MSDVYSPETLQRLVLDGIASAYPGYMSDEWRPLSGHARVDGVDVAWNCHFRRVGDGPVEIRDASLMSAPLRW